MTLRLGRRTPPNQAYFLKIVLFIEHSQERCMEKSLKQLDEWYILNTWIICGLIWVNQLRIIENKFAVIPQCCHLDYDDLIMGVCFDSSSPLIITGFVVDTYIDEFE